ncbi:MAG: formylglycine-generating enzyme family protein [Deltaproteobacteria bacterium]|nr:formylglycine-generating enzyme family protein [Deltaproteobacteria bacterium]
MKHKVTTHRPVPWKRWAGLVAFLILFAGLGLGYLRGWDSRKFLTMDRIPENTRVEAAPIQDTVEPKEWVDSITKMEFVRVPGGCYEMGSTTGAHIEKPVHEVCVDGFWIGKYEVTVGRYRQFLQATGDAKGVGWEKKDCPMKRDSGYSLKGNKFGKDENQPMVEVNWYGAKSFADWLSQKTGETYRLPTEAEWEYAARSGEKNEKYAGGDHVDSMAWYLFNTNDATHVIGTKEPNGLGIYDMSGNVWEWCLDGYSGDAYERHQRENPMYENVKTIRVIRGGAWNSTPVYVRCTTRYYSGAAGYENFVGFRLVRTK